MADRVLVQPTSRDEAPARPPHFDARYVLPAHRVKLLQTLNAHPIDCRLVFHEEEHVYEFDGVPAEVSVSGLAHEYCEHFHGPSTIAKMQKSSNWPRLKYVVDPIEVTDDKLDGSRPLILVDADGVTRSTVRGEKRSDAKSKWYTYDRVMTEKEILQAWEDNGEDARNRGTEAHLQMELFLNSEAHRDDPETLVGKEFVATVMSNRSKAYRTEMEVYGWDEDVAGCVDAMFAVPDMEYEVGDPRAKIVEPEIDGTVVLLTGEVVKNRETTRKAVDTTDIGRMLSADGVVLRVDGEIRGCTSHTVQPSRISAVDEQTVATASGAIVNPPRNTRKIVLVDWKRSDKLAADMVSKYRKRMRRPLHHLDDCSGSAYALQLSAYQYILEKYYGFRIVGRALADIHPECPFHSWTPYLHDEIEYIMAMRRERTRVRRELERVHPELRCAKSGRLLTDAVVDKEGRRYHRKAALFVDATVVDDEATSATCERMIREKSIPIALHSCTPWVKLMPAEGIRGAFD